MTASKEAEAKHQEVISKIIHDMDTSSYTVHKMGTQQALKHYGVDLKKGLSTKAAEERLAEHGPNELDEEEGESIWAKIKEQFEDLLVQILLGAATISFIFACIGDGDEGLTAFVEPFVIILILVLNGAVAIWQDADADKALEALKSMQAVSSTCLRDGKWQNVNASDLVPGDIVQVNAGMCVPADLRVIEINSISLQAGQAALTGESVSVRKMTESLGESAKMIQDQKNMLFSSTMITSGSAVGLVSYTGMKTAIGSIHKEVQAASEDEADTPLKQKIDQFGDYLAKVIFVICFLVWIMNFSKFSDPIHGSTVKGCIYYFKIAVALAVAAIPEGLPAVITTCLALGTRKMAQNNCIVRRLPSVETLGCTSTICSDKTGTLTRNLMCAIKFGVVNSGENDIKEFSVEEKGYDTNGKVLSGYSAQELKGNANLQHIAAVCTLNNRARIIEKNSAYECQGEPTEGAMKVLAEKIMISDCSKVPMAYFDKLNKQVTEVAVLDFSSDRKAMSTVVSGYHGSGNTVLLKGAPERVIDMCSSVLTKDGIASSMSGAAKEALNR